MATKNTRSLTRSSGKDRRTDIVEAAFECLQSDGYAKLTARKIAARSNISLGNITYHFKTMDDVLIAAYRHASAILVKATEAETSPHSESPEDALRAYLKAGFGPEFLKHDYLRVRIDLWSAALGSVELARLERDLYDRYRASLVKILTEIAAKRGADTQAIPVLSDTIIATLDGLWLDWERRQDKQAIDNGLEGCMRLVEAMLKGAQG